MSTIVFLTSQPSLIARSAFQFPISGYVAGGTQLTFLWATFRCEFDERVSVATYIGAIALGTFGLAVGLRVGAALTGWTTLKLVSYLLAVLTGFATVFFLYSAGPAAWQAAKSLRRLPEETPEETVLDDSELREGGYIDESDNDQRS